jgi:hypothetical protein
VHIHAVIPLFQNFGLVETFRTLRLKKRLFPLKIVPQNHSRIKTQYMQNRPLLYKIALAVAALETIAAAAVTLFFIWGLVTGQAKVLTALALIVGLLVATTAFLASATKAFFELKRWGRSALIFWQLIQVSLGYGTMEGKGAIYWLAIVIFAVSGITFVMLFTKPVSALFEEN